MAERPGQYCHFNGSQSLGLRQWGTLRLQRLNSCRCVRKGLCVDVLSLNPTLGVWCVEGLRHAAAAHSDEIHVLRDRKVAVSACGMTDPATVPEEAATQVSVILYLTWHLYSTTRLSVSAVKVSCAVGAVGSVKHLKVLDNNGKYVEFPLKKVFVSICCKKGQCVWLIVTGYERELSHMVHQRSTKDLTFNIMPGNRHLCADIFWRPGRNVQDRMVIFMFPRCLNSLLLVHCIRIWLMHIVFEL